MLKRIICGLLCVMLLLNLSPAALGAEEEIEAASGRVLEIDNVWELQLFAANAILDSYSRDLTVVLNADLDLTGEDFSGIPIFCGTFLGNDHTISGLTLTSEGSNLGFFRYLTETALVTDLTVRGSILPAGSQESIGGIAGSNAGRIQTCDF